MSTGSAAPPKNSKWEFFERLQFLELVPTERSTASNVYSDSTVPSTWTANEQSETQSGKSVQCPNEAPQSQKLTPPPPPPNKKRRKKEDDFLDYLKKRDESRQMLMEELSAKTSATEIEDDVTSFGNNVKSVLRKLNPRLKIQAKNEIFNILTKYEMLQMDMQETSLSPAMSSSTTSFISQYSPVSTPSTSEPTELIQTQCRPTTPNEESYYNDFCDIITKNKI